MELINLKKRRKIRESREITKTLSIDSYLQVIHDYFLEFLRGLRSEWFGRLIAFMAIGVACMGRILIKEPTWHWLVGLPILFAMISAALHSISLPFMMYLIPSSREQRERYIERMLLICMSSSISRIEFWAIFTVMTVLMLPMTLVIRKHWRQIRQNFADYESCRNNTVLTETR